MNAQAPDKKSRVSLILFLVLLFAVSWIGTIPMFMASRGAKEAAHSLRALQILMLFGPGLVAVLVTAINHGKQGVKNLLGGLLKWRVNPGLYAIALLGPFLLFLAIRQACSAFGIVFPPLSSAGAVLMSFASSFVVYLVLNTEELAWRGVALPQLQAKHGPLVASTFLGILWGVFHAPLFLLKGGHPAGYSFPLYMIMVFAMTFIFTWLFNRSSGSLLIVHLFHQSINAWAEAIPTYPKACGSFVPTVCVVIVFCICALLALWKKFAFVPGSNAPDPATS